MRKALSLLIMGAILWCCSGCWSRTEIEQMAFISVIGVDKAGSGLLVSFQIIDPKALAKGGGGGGGAGGGTKAINVISVKARDLPEALARLAEKSSKAIRLKQLSAIVMGEGLARSGLAPVLDFFTRHWEVRRSTWVLVARGQAREILQKGMPTGENVPGIAIRNLMQQPSLLASGRYPMVLGDLAGILSRDMDAVVSKVELDQGDRSADQGAGEAGRGDEKKGGELLLKGAGVFRKDKMVGFLGPSETRGICWLKGKVRGGVTTVPVATRGTWASLVTDRANARIKPEITKNRIRYLVEIEDYGFI